MKYNHTLKSVMVTGGAGFIASNFLHRYVFMRKDITFINYDALTYAGNLENVGGMEVNPNYQFVKGDICDGPAVLKVLKEYNVDTIFNFAAESHVDRSILSGAEFIRTNVGGTQTLLQTAMEAGVGRFVQVSTDEVYGSLGEAGKFVETTPLSPNSPYSASKASADLLCNAYHHTFGLPVVITRCSNNYGPYQFPEKLIPLMIINALGDKELPVYGDGMNVRDWIHVNDHCAAVMDAAELGKPGEIYNIGADNEWPNIEIVRAILRILDKPESLIRRVKDRPGHDRRYAIDAAKAREELCWSPTIDFETGLHQTVEWYLQNKDWWERVMTGAYKDYYEKNYRPKLG